jgi:hypothetical protein
VWNSCPIPGTNISCSLVPVGCKFAFPIDYSTNKHWELTSFPNGMDSYSRDLATHLAALCEVANLLVQEQQAYHCSWSIHGNRIPTPTWSGISSSFVVQFDPMPQKDVWTNFNTHSLAHGKSPRL